LPSHYRLGIARVVFDEGVAVHIAAQAV